jgi:hypothetical protein
MKLLLPAHHPAWARQFAPLVERLREEGHETKIVAIKKDVALDLLDAYGLDYEVIAETTGATAFAKARVLLQTTARIAAIIKREKPDVLIGRVSPMFAINARRFGLPYLVFEDTEHARIALWFCKRYATRVLTGSGFRDDLGPKQRRTNTYKELFALHPNRFTPDPSALAEAGLREDEPFAVLRFVSWTADHDFGVKGLTLETKRRAVEAIAERARPVISSETPLPPELESYRFRAKPELMPHLLARAELLYGESATMAAEAAVLGTPAIFCDHAGRGYTDELERDYGLVFNFGLDATSQDASIGKLRDMTRDDGLKRRSAEARDRLLREKRDGTDVFYEELTALASERGIR